MYKIKEKEFGFEIYIYNIADYHSSSFFLSHLSHLYLLLLLRVHT